MNTAALFCMAALGTYYFLRKREEKIKALICKAAATSLPLFLLIWNFETAIDAGPLPYWCTAAGIVFYMAADVLLECRFIPGAVCFAAGHVSMAAGFAAGVRKEILSGIREFPGVSGHAGAAAWTAALSLLFIGAAYAALHRYFPYLKKKKVLTPAAGYITVLSIMAALVVTDGVQKGMLSGNWNAWIPAAGGICFVISDILLGQNRFGKRRSRKKGAAVLILYYLSVYLFSMRLWF